MQKPYSKLWTCKILFIICAILFYVGIKSGLGYIKIFLCLATFGGAVATFVEILMIEFNHKYKSNGQNPIGSLLKIIGIIFVLLMFLPRLPNSFLGTGYGSELANRILFLAIGVVSFVVGEKLPNNQTNRIEAKEKVETDIKSEKISEKTNVEIEDKPVKKDLDPFYMTISRICLIVFVISAPSFLFFLILYQVEQSIFVIRFFYMIFGGVVCGSILLCIVSYCLALASKNKDDEEHKETTSNS